MLGVAQGRGSQALGIVSMSGTTDMAGVPILMVAYNGEACVRLYQLPDFGSRGVLTPVSDACLAEASPHGNGASRACGAAGRDARGRGRVGGGVSAIRPCGQQALRVCGPCLRRAHGGPRWRRRGRWARWRAP